MCPLCQAYPVTNLPDLVDDARCSQDVRERRWHDRVTCPYRGSLDVVTDSKDDTHHHRHWYDDRGSAAWK